MGRNPIRYIKYHVSVIFNTLTVFFSGVLIFLKLLVRNERHQKGRKSSFRKERNER